MPWCEATQRVHALWCVVCSMAAGVRKGIGKDLGNPGRCPAFARRWQSRFWRVAGLRLVAPAWPLAAGASKSSLARKAQAPSVNRKFHGFAPDSFLHPAARLLRAAETARCPAWTRSLTHLTRMIGQLAQPMIHKLRSPIRVVCPTLVVYPGRSVRFPSLQLPRNGQIAAEAPIRRSFFKPPTSDQS